MGFLEYGISKKSQPRKQVGASIPKDIADEYLFLKRKIETINDNGQCFTISLTEPFTDTVKLLNKEMRQCLDKYGIDYSPASFKSLEETEGSTLGDLLRAARDS
jgi:hypothetical protein